MSDPVNHPAHYTAGKVEAIEAIEAALGEQGFRAYLRGQVLKYCWRTGLKDDPLQDLRKAAWYLERLIADITKARAEVAGQGIPSRHCATCQTPVACAKHGPCKWVPLSQNAPQRPAGEATAP